jgi:uncharacterized protein YigA (DUF484 family)
MTLQELYDALHELLGDESKKDESVYVDVEGRSFELKAISVIVQSDNWVPNTVVASVEEVFSEDEVEQGAIDGD